MTACSSDDASGKLNDEQKVQLNWRRLILISQVVSLPLQSMEIANFCAVINTLVDQDGGDLKINRAGAINLTVNL